MGSWLEGYPHLDIAGSLYPKPQHIQGLVKALPAPSGL